jgi:TRAP-type transport system small permease protein
MKTGAGHFAERWIGWLIQLERLIAAGLLMVVFGTMAAQVLARYVFRAPIAWSEEVARFALIWLAFVAAAFVMAEGRHITVDVLSNRLGSRGKLLLECLSSSLVVASCLLLLIGGLRFVRGVGLVGSPALGIPMSWWYGAASTGLALMALHSLLNTIFALLCGRPLWDARVPGDEDSGIGGAA